MKNAKDWSKCENRDKTKILQMIFPYLHQLSMKHPFRRPKHMKVWIILKVVSLQELRMYDLWQYYQQKKLENLILFQQWL